MRKPKVPESLDADAPWRVLGVQADPDDRERVSMVVELKGRLLLNLEVHRNLRTGKTSYSCHDASPIGTTAKQLSALVAANLPAPSKCSKTN